MFEFDDKNTQNDEIVSWIEFVYSKKLFEICKNVKREQMNGPLR